MEALKREITLEEAVELGAVSGEFFGSFFFPRACRMSTPAFHLKLDEALDDPGERYVSAMIFRGGAKTTKTRIYAARRIAYGISRTIVIVGKSQEHAIKTVEWLMNAIEYGGIYAQTFGLQRGKKWTSADIEIRHSQLGHTVRIIALGITGSTRGVNIEDYRPDLIIVDDPCDEENTATPEQRKKISELFFGALQKSLAPQSEAPFAKMVLLQTVLNGEDLISLCDSDPQWCSLRFSCFDENGASRWPERWSTEELLAEKQAHINRNQLGLWLREMECTVVSDATCAFLPEWIQYYEHAPEGGAVVIGVDPTPPPKDVYKPINQKLDDAVIVALKACDGNFFVLDTYAAKSPDPFEFVVKIFEFYREYKAVKLCVETVLFARMLASILERAQNQQRFWMILKKIEDKRKKSTRIRQDVGEIATNRRLYVRKTQSELIQQLITYPDTAHDDYLDALAIAIQGVETWMHKATIEGEYEVLDKEELQMLENWRTAP